MKKFLLSLFAIIIASFSMMAQSVLITPSDMKASNSSTKYVTEYFEFADTDTGTKFKAIQVNPNTGQIKVNATSGSAFNLYNTTSIPSIKTVTVLADQTTLGTWYMSTSSSAAQTSSASASSSNIQGTVSGKTVVFNVPAGKDVSYFHINLTGKGSGTVKFVSIEILQATDAKQQADISYPKSAYEVTLGEEFELPTLSNPKGLAVTYESSNSAVASIDNAGVVTVKAEGTTTITATSDETADFAKGVASYTLTVNPALTLGEILANGSEETDLTVFAGDEIEFSAENAEVITYAVDGAAAETGSVWTPTAVGEYEVVVTATFRGETNTKTFNVTAEKAPVVKEATLTFDDTSKRTEFSSTRQVWEENGIIVTNNKASSTSNVADYYKPARFYKNSSLTVALDNADGVITKIVFDCKDTSYATALKNAIVSGASVTVSSDKVTVVPTEEMEAFTISALSGGQVQMDALTVTYYVPGEEGETPDEPELGAIKVNGEEVENGAVLNAWVNEALEFSAENAESITYTVGEGEAIEGTTWTPESEGEFAVTVSATRGEQNVSVSFTAVVTEKEPAEPLGAYVKVVDAPTDWSGRYLIVYEADNKVFDGSLEMLDATTNFKEVAIEIDEAEQQLGKHPLPYIEVTEEVEACEFVISQINGGYSIKSHSGYYIGNTTASNELYEDKSKEYKNSISLKEDGSVEIKALDNNTPSYLQFNSSTDQLRFRYYKSWNQKAFTCIDI